MPRRGMFSRADGTNIIEPDMQEHVHWVTVDFSRFGGRTRPNSGESMMRLMGEQCRSGVATIGTEPQHHKNPYCLSLPVVGDPALAHVDIMARAAEIADWHWEEIMASRETLDTARILGDHPWWDNVPINGE
ncbi:hypothetical protein N7457_003599 [Penicillium paradoxum]|uniref:uncharacterized protein n=1 Tax=Penicillium paradoxum TaxID=176176 RepID=UPI0025474EC0|nr:uncharacterized protein N7457_003599 [Penicillium paradoxum]KAJ5788609.1 hypothetical protein N7457_003599 [Penicillium paradoxum]